jgi:hypothetical protein
MHVVRSMPDSREAVVTGAVHFFFVIAHLYWAAEQGEENHHLVPALRRLVYVYTHTHTHTHIGMYVYMYVCMSVCMYVYM